jgi:predicted Zn-dependent peptidase
LFLPDYVDSEREKLCQRLEAMRNDRAGWAKRRLMENMCAMEDYAVSAYGSADEAENIHYVKLTKDYRALLGASPMEFFYCGSRSGEDVAELLRGALLLLPRGEIDLDMGTDVRMNALEAEPRYFTEEMDVTQGNLAMGFRLGKCMEDPDEAAILIFNAVYGGCVTSKLFSNVRERLSLCYYAISSVDLHKGIMAVSSGIDFDKYDMAREEILTQLEAMRAGDITPEELSGAKKATANAMRTVPDSPAALEGFYLAQAVKGLDASPMDMAALMEDVTAEQVVDIARGVELDAVFFLRGEAGE